MLLFVQASRALSGSVPESVVAMDWRTVKYLKDRLS